MKVLLTSSRGFIGRTLKAALERAGHTVVAGVSPRRTPHAGEIAVDFTRDTSPAAWLPRLEGVDAVVNAVGVLRDHRTRPMDAIHRDTPQALFDACAQAGVQRVIQISALGIEHSDTHYATSKRAAERHVLALMDQGRLRPAVLRPSVVFGRGGDSSAMFMNLASLPVALFPGPVLDARIQPVSVHDLAQAVVALLGPAMDSCGVIECVGPEPLTMGAFIASLRRQLGRGPARVLRMPSWLTRLSARAGDWVPSSPWCTESLAMLGTDNVGHAAQFEQLLGRRPVHYATLVASAWQPQNPARG